MVFPDACLCRSLPFHLFLWYGTMLTIIAEDIVVVERHQHQLYFVDIIVNVVFSKSSLKLHRQHCRNLRFRLHCQPASLQRRGLHHYRHVRLLLLLCVDVVTIVVAFVFSIGVFIDIDIDIVIASFALIANIVESSSRTSSSAFSSAARSIHRHRSGNNLSFVGIV